jgi:putative ATPase
VLFWGPPGCGKTSLAHIYLSSFSCPNVDLHPTRFQAAEVKRVLEEAAASPLFRPTIFWIDEIHRLTRPQQDLLLRALEDGTIALVAATTENPSFVLSNALLSRLTVLTFASLEENDLIKLLDRVIHSHPHVGIEEEAKKLLIGWAVGDARKLLSLLEPLVEQKTHVRYDAEAIRELLSHHSGGLTSEGEGRYLLISALHKSVRGSDCQAALYWLARLLTAGEDPLYLARRLIRMSIEDVGLADPQALSLALDAQECYRAMGSPEGDLALAEVTIYLALAPKSASSYVAFNKARAIAAQTAHLIPPSHILNAPTRWMKEQGFSKGYAWDHDCADAFSGQEYFPEGVAERTYFVPVQRGFERELERRLEYFQRLRKERRASSSEPDGEKNL